MMKFLSVAALVLASLSAQAERLLYTDVPLKIAVPIGAERVLRLPQACEVGVPSELQGSLRIESTESVLLLKAVSAFPETRLILRALGSQRVYLLDITAAKSASKSDVELIDARLQASTNQADSAEPIVASPEDPRVALVRFASKEFYAPMRLRGGIDAVRVPVERVTVPLLRGGAIQTEAVAAWSYQGVYLTAFLARNNTSERRTIDPRQLRGDWLAASSQHAEVAAMGLAGDTTMLYLLSAQPYIVPVVTSAVKP